MFEDILSSKFYAVSVTLTRYIFLTVLLIIFSLPVITIGASLAATIATIRQPEYPTFQLFWRSFRMNILRGGVVFLFSGFTIMFIFQFAQFARVMPFGNTFLFVVSIFLIVYNLNAYLFVDILKKCSYTFFRQVFFFTIGTIYKTFFIPIIAFGFAFVAPIIGGWPLLFMSIPVVLAIYVRMVRNDIETAMEAVEELN